MKKAKKLAALFLAMVMAFSLMAVTAAAYGEDEHVHTGECCEESVEPRGLSPQCPKCGVGTVRNGAIEINGKYYPLYICPSCGNQIMDPTPLP